MIITPLTQADFPPLFINPTGWVNFKQIPESKPWTYDLKETDELAGRMTFYRFPSTAHANLFGGGIVANPDHDADETYITQSGQYLLVTYCDAEENEVKFLDVTPN